MPVPPVRLVALLGIGLSCISIAWAVESYAGGRTVLADGGYTLLAYTDRGILYVVAPGEEHQEALRSTKFSTSPVQIREIGGGSPPHPDSVLFFCSLWFLGTALLVPGVFVLLGSYPRFCRWIEGRCQHCGYRLHGLPALRCPECGTPFDEAGPVAKDASYRYHMKAGLVCLIAAIWIIDSAVRPLHVGVPVGVTQGWVSTFGYTIPQEIYDDVPIALVLAGVGISFLVRWDREPPIPLFVTACVIALAFLLGNVGRIVTWWIASGGALDWVGASTFGVLCYFLARGHAGGLMKPKAPGRAFTWWWPQSNGGRIALVIAIGLTMLLGALVVPFVAVVCGVQAYLLGVAIRFIHLWPQTRRKAH